MEFDDVIPLGDMSLIKPVFKEHNGILMLPDSLKKSVVGGIVLSKGPKVSNAFEVGETIIYGHWVGILLEPEKEVKSVRLIKEFEIVGKKKPETK